MPKPYTPTDWYWLADDGRVFASGRASVVTEKDSAYKAFVADAGAATVWPRDEASAQTDAALNEVLAPFNIAVGGKPAGTLLTAMNFMSLFTPDEQTAIITADDPQVKLFCWMAAAASGVDLADPRTIAGTKQLETLKLISKGRAKQVLAGQAPPADPAQTAA